MNGKVVRFSAERVLCIGEVERGRIISVPNVTVFFLEEGNSASGYQHIIANHGQDFVNRGISEDQIMDFIFRTVTQEIPIGTRNDRSGRPTSVYEVSEKQYLIGIGDNGYLVNSLPFS